MNMSDRLIVEKIDKIRKDKYTLNQNLNTNINKDKDSSNNFSSLLDTEINKLKHNK